MAAVLFLPKCALCVAGYVAAGSGLFAAARELCGPTEVRGGTVADAALLAGVVVLVGAAGLWWRNRPPVSGTPPPAR